MLQLKHLMKTYQVGDTVTHALDDVSINFRNHEFVAILGPSGSGKTTMLNVIGGLDQYDSGDIIINGKSTKNFSQTDWDAYRNNTVGFIFQNYNLISHLSIIENVELGMTLSGVDSKTRHQKAIDALKRVGLGDHLQKNPNQLSGGQMQRVAIARAIANDPDILLCDEPTGALDTKTSVEIMKLIKELSKDKLVIMVTHNPELAQEYASRTVHFQDGKILSDSNKFTPDKDIKDSFNLIKTKMSYLNALKLSFTNIMTKKGRTFLTAFASSIGIIGIAIVLALSNGFQKQIDQTQTKTLSKFPISISTIATDLDPAQRSKDSDKNVKNKGFLIAAKPDNEKNIHENKITQNYINYIKKINPNYANNISYIRSVQLNLLSNNAGKIKRIQFSTLNNSGSSLVNAQSQGMASVGINSSVFPTSLDQSKGSFLKNNYQLLSGNWPSSKNDVVLVLNNKNEANLNSLKNLGLDIKDGEKINFKKLVGKTFKLISNNDYYQQLPTGNFVPNKLTKSLYNKGRTITLTGVIRSKNNSQMALLDNSIAYSDALSEAVIKENKNSNIVKAQKKSSTNVMTNQAMNETEKAQFIASIGGSSIPNTILIYPNSFNSKDKVLNYLDKWNKGKAKKDKIVYTDMSGTVTKLTGGLLSGITDVLVAFAAISLITSMIMIGILTYTSVLERTKEIGILKALGARKRDITRVFDAETFILGVFSGALGILIAYLLTFPINSVLYYITDMTNVAQLNPTHALALIIISTILTLLGGHIPARIAAKKDAAIALRSE
ncbi:putative ABC transport system ATP-binding protein/putative ABC transport system permease protein [Lactobacillus colini]|uniref:ABC transport system ATP-binding protein/putative ABC transport system permease protein n=1 Tax=Lactobacillus colini TaxID=1819254 RepID=A0ABS4MG40_9LACO|nr:ABC transporter ATP-binding protein/permease [Lactobacillus colini]MBP2058324.1 putative ABC transport system ATP-binding protein/putative ABC transport system permease protein [Lactobacillus colini]